MKIFAISILLFTMVLNLSNAQTNGIETSDENWDDSFDFAFDPNLNGTVNALAVDGGDVYVGGNFTTAGGISVNNIAKWDGSAWSNLGNGLDKGVQALAVIGSELYAADSDGGLNKWDGNSWSYMVSGVNALAVSGSNLYVGGNFNVPGALLPQYVAKWDGSNWFPLRAVELAGTYVDALAAEGSNLYAGGNFVELCVWDGTDWSNLTNPYGSNIIASLAVSSGDIYIVDEDQRFYSRSGTNWTFMDVVGVDAIAVNETDVYIGGSFTTAGGVSANNIAKWDGNEWSPLGSGLNNSVYALAASDNHLYVGGIFTTANSENVNSITMWDGSSWLALGDGVEVEENFTVNALAVDGGDVYVGGNFTTAGGISVNNIAKWDGSAWSNLGNGLDKGVQALAVIGSELYAADSDGGLNKWDGNSWSYMVSGVNALAVSGSNLYVGGNFNVPGALLPQYVAKWDGSNWFPLRAVELAGTYVDALAAEGSNLYAGGNFVELCVWDGTDWSNLTNPYGSNIIASLAVSSGDIYIVDEDQRFYSRSGTNWTFMDVVGVDAIAVNGTDVYVGGSFTTAGGVSANNIAKWDGCEWSPLGSGLNNSVYALAANDNNLYVGGVFTTAGGIPSSLFGRWNITRVQNNCIVTIPDPNFEQALIDIGIDSDGVVNQQILRSDATDVIKLDLNNPPDNSELPNVHGKIGDLAGIEAFVSLENLDIGFNELSEIDLSNTIRLKTLQCQGNQLVSLEILNNPDLTYLLCSNNLITDLDLSQNASLKYLFCSNNSISNLNVSNNPELLRLWCGSNKLSDIDISNNNVLEQLYCHNNTISDLDVSENTLLKVLQCEVNQLNNLDLTLNTQLKELHCGKNLLTSLDITNNINLNVLACYYNQLSELELVNNSELTQVLCFVNQLNQLDLAANSKLKILDCRANHELTFLDMRNGNNHNVEFFNVILTDLTCINVDDETSDHSSWVVDEGVVYSNDCNNNTQIGNDIAIVPIDPITETSPVEVIYQDVTLSGNTTLEIDNTGPEYPQGFSVGNPPTVFNIETTASHSGIIQIVIDYSGISYEDETTLRLIHYESGQWVDVTSFVDFENKLIYGEVLNLSQFAILQDIQPPMLISIPDDVTVINDPGQAEAIVNYTIPTATDNSPGVLVEQTDGTGLTSGSFFPIGTTTLSYQATDVVGHTVSCSFSITVHNPAPVIDNISAPVDPVALGNSVTMTVSFDDNNLNQATIDWGDDSDIVPGIISGQTISWDYTYDSTGVYEVTVQLVDMGGRLVDETYRYIVVFDASDGFVTGGGWINSSLGAYTADPTLEGKANFGFVSKYKKGSTVPTGNTEFQFKAGNLNFNSYVYDWLVIAGSKAMFKGKGTINGSGEYGFLLSAIDGDLKQNAQVDKFRIKIWELANDANVIYDNELNEFEDAPPTTDIGGGSIVIHNGSKQKSETISDIENYEQSLSLIALYPNPFTNIAYVEVQHNESIELMINVYDMGGRLIEILHEGRIKENVRYRFEFTPDGGLASGTLIVKFILDNENVISKQLILAK